MAHLTSRRKPFKNGPVDVAGIILPQDGGVAYNRFVTHAQLVKLAESWLRQHHCRIVLSEQTVDSGEVPDVIGWQADCHSFVVECKASRADFFADQRKLVRRKPELGMGCERYYLAPKGIIRPQELPSQWGLLEARGKEITVMTKSDSRSQRTNLGLMTEMELLLASLRRVEARIEPQTITEFLKWKNRMAIYNGGQLPRGLSPPEQDLLS